MRKINRHGQHIPRVPRLILANQMEVVMFNVSTHSSSDQALVLSRPEAAIQALQFGGFTAANWRDLGDTCNVGQVLAKPPYNLANDHIDLFLSAETVLRELNDQYTAKRTWTARAAQLQTLKDALEIHDIQLRYVSQGELQTAATEVRRTCAEALRGNGGNVSVVRLAA